MNIITPMAGTLCFWSIVGPPYIVKKMDLFFTSSITKRIWYLFASSPTVWLMLVAAILWHGLKETLTTTEPECSGLVQRHRKIPSNNTRIQVNTIVKTKT